jgi:hypothetical protein
MSSSSSSYGTDQTQSLMIDVRANTQGFSQDLASMRGSFDNTLVAGFTQAGAVLDSGLANALAKGTNGFTALRATAMGALNDIAAQANGSMFNAVTSDSGSASMVGLTGLLGVSGLMSTLMGLPGRATGGPVSPGQPYLVGERGPEMFVPTSAGSIAANGSGGGGRDVNVAINVNAPAGGSTPQSLQRSSRQVASAVRRALTQF